MTKWWSVFGVLLDIFGFLIIASEWWQAVRQGDIIKAQISRMGFWGGDDEEELARKQEIAIEQLDRRRSWLFGTGVFMILAGFAAQMIGSWPCK